MEILRQARPVLQMIIEKHGVIFRVIQSKLSKAKALSDESRGATIPATNIVNNQFGPQGSQNNKLGSLDSLSNAIGQVNMRSDGNINDPLSQRREISQEELHLNLAVSSAMEIDGQSTDADNGNSGSNMLISFPQPNATPILPVNMQSWEWNIFKLLVTAKVEQFASRSPDHTKWDAATVVDTSNSVRSIVYNPNIPPINSHETKNSDTNRIDNSPLSKEIDVRKNDSQKKAHSNGGPAWKYMIQECKKLRADVMKL
jgi:hypothetical protein